MIRRNFRQQVLGLIPMAVSTVLAGVMALVPVDAKASLIGDEISAEVLVSGGIFTDLNVHIVGAGPEGNWFNEIGYNLDASTITLRSLRDAAPNTFWGDLEFSFFDLDWLPGPGQIIGVSVISATGAGWSLIDNSDLSFTADSVLIDASIIAGFPQALDQQVTIQLRATHVPEPATTLTLFCISLAGLGFARRRNA